MKRRDSLMKLTYAARREDISDSANISTTTMVEEFTHRFVNGSRGMFYPIFAALLVVIVYSAYSFSKRLISFLAREIL